MKSLHHPRSLSQLMHVDTRKTCRPQLHEHETGQQVHCRPNCCRVCASTFHTMHGHVAGSLVHA